MTHPPIIPSFARTNRSTPLEWLIGCDESGTSGLPYYGFGTLWMDANRRGDLLQDIEALRMRHKARQRTEFKWNTVDGGDMDFYRALVDYFFKTPRMAFHCMVVRKGLVDKARYSDAWVNIRVRQFTMLLTQKMHNMPVVAPKVQHKFRVWVDPIPTKNKKIGETIQAISGNWLMKLRAGLKTSPVLGVHMKDSKETAQIQLCDLLLGAVTDTWNEKSSNPGKAELKRHIAERMKWNDLRADTYPTALKFNIWYYLPRNARREVEVRRTLWEFREQRGRVRLGLTPRRST